MIKSLHRLPLASLGALFLLPALSAQDCMAEPLSLKAAQIQSLGIQTARVGDIASPRNDTLPAKVVVPNAQLRVVTAPIGGMIERLAVAAGDTVKRGQIVAHLSSPQALELQRDALQSASQLGLLQQNLKRDEQLFAEGLIAESRVQGTRAAAAQATAQADERAQGLALAGIQAGKLGGPLALAAPIDGVVLEQGVQLGQRIESATPIYRIAKLSPLWLEIQVPQTRLGEIRDGMSVKLVNSAISGKIIAIGRAIDTASQTVTLRASISRGAEALIPGQVVDVELSNANSGASRLPARVLTRHEGRTWVFVQIGAAADDAEKNAGSRFEARAVRLISQHGDSVQVEGVSANERLVIDGVSGLKALLAGVGRP